MRRWQLFGFQSVTVRGTFNLSTSKHVNLAFFFYSFERRNPPALCQPKVKKKATVLRVIDETMIGVQVGCQSLYLQRQSPPIELAVHLIFYTEIKF